MYGIVESVLHLLSCDLTPVALARADRVLLLSSHSQANSLPDACYSGELDASLHEAGHRTEQGRHLRGASIR